LNIGSLLYLYVTYHPYAGVTICY